MLGMVLAHSRVGAATARARNPASLPACAAWRELWTAGVLCRSTVLFSKLTRSSRRWIPAGVRLAALVLLEAVLIAAIGIHPVVALAGALVQLALCTAFMDGKAARSAQWRDMHIRWSFFLVYTLYTISLFPSLLPLAKQLAHIPRGNLLHLMGVPELVPLREVVPPLLHIKLLVYYPLSDLLQPTWLRAQVPLAMSMQFASIFCAIVSWTHAYWSQYFVWAVSLAELANSLLSMNAISRGRARRQRTD